MYCVQYTLCILHVHCAHFTLFSVHLHAHLQCAQCTYQMCIVHPPHCVVCTQCEPTCAFTMCTVYISDVHCAPFTLCSVNSSLAGKWSEVRRQMVPRRQKEDALSLSSLYFSLYLSVYLALYLSMISYHYTFHCTNHCASHYTYHCTSLYLSLYKYITNTNTHKKKNVLPARELSNQLQRSFHLRFESI